jgi:hypothetical protein
LVTAASERSVGSDYHDDDAYGYAANNPDWTDASRW